MAKSNMYCIYDKIGGESGPIFHAKNDLVALRHYDLMIENNEPAWKVDFQLLYVGQYNHESCIITASKRVITVEEKIDDAETI